MREKVEKNLFSCLAENYFPCRLRAVTRTTRHERLVRSAFFFFFFFFLKPASNRVKTHTGGAPSIFSRAIRSARHHRPFYSRVELPSDQSQPVTFTRKK